MSEHCARAASTRTTSFGAVDGAGVSTSRRMRGSGPTRTCSSTDLGDGAGLARSARTTRTRQLSTGPRRGRASSAAAGSDGRHGRRTRGFSTSSSAAGIRSVRHVVADGRSTSTRVLAGARLAGRESSVRTFRPGDERAFYEAHRRPSPTPGSRSRRRSRSGRTSCSQPRRFDPELWFLASKREARLAGFAICHPHAARLRARLGARPRRTAAVARPRPRAALCFSTHSTRSTSAGCARAGLGVDAESPTGANRLYERSGMRGRPGSRSTRRRSRELPARPLSRLQDVHRGRGRRRLRVPQLWQRRSRRDSSASRPRGARAARRWPKARAWRSRIRRSRSSSATRSTSRPRRSPRRSLARPIVLGGCCCTHVGAAPRARAQGRSARHRLDRRPRRPEHARDVALREPLGDAVPDDPRRRRRGGRRRRARRRAQPRPAGGRSSWQASGSTTRSTARSQAWTRRTSRSTSTCSTRARSTCSSPSPTGLRPTRSKRSSATIAGRTTDRRDGRHRALSRPIATLALATRMLAAAGF